jgi:hypothetical protein
LNGKKESVLTLLIICENHAGYKPPIQFQREFLRLAARFA